MAGPADLPIPPDQERKTERLFVRVGPGLKSLLEERAREDRRELADWCRLALERAAAAERKKRR